MHPPAKLPMFVFDNRGIRMDNLSALVAEYSFFINMGFVVFAVVVAGFLLRKRGPELSRGTK